jgi:hypothetical protein
VDKLAEGLVLGSVLGFADGCSLGALVEDFVGAFDGDFVGMFVGVLVGNLVGALEGIFVGVFVGVFVGTFVGDFVGAFVGAIGALVGATGVLAWPFCSRAKRRYEAWQKVPTTCVCVCDRASATTWPAISAKRNVLDARRNGAAAHLLKGFLHIEDVRKFAFV